MKKSSAYKNYMLIFFAVWIAFLFGPILRTAQASSPFIDVWYGPHQVFGSIGVPQRWVNILGNVSDPHGVVSLSYSLNGGSTKALSMGPDDRRLPLPGDFNVDLDYWALPAGMNQLVIRATDGLGDVATVTVTVEKIAGRAWPLPYSIDWGTVGQIQDVAQIVDGLWSLQPGGIGPVLLGYDRLVDIGDLTWSDYEVTVPVTIHGIVPPGDNPPSGPPAIGILVRWPGHSDWGGRQPLIGWFPFGALGHYRYITDSAGYRLRIMGNEGTTIAEDWSGKKLAFGVPYRFKMRAETFPGQYHQYRLKVWRSSDPEPATWDLTATEPLTEPGNGSVLLLAHHVDATFGNVSVVPIGSGPGGGDPLGIVSDDFSGSTLDTGLWTFENPLGDGSVAMTGTQAAISVPAGPDHDVWRKGNLAPRLMQVAVNTDFEVEAKFDSLPTQQYQLQGILVEQDAQNFLRFDFYSDGSSLRLFAATFTGGSPSVKSNKAIGGGGPPLYLRIKRVGNQWTQLYSYDGVTWLTNVTFTHALTVTAVGPFASNAQGSGPAPAYTGLVDYFFNTASPIVPEDGGGSVLNVNVVGSGSVTKSPDQSSYEPGEVVTLTAVPASGWAFAGWSGALSGTANPVQLTMNGPASVTATFTAVPALPSLVSLSVSPSSVVGGSSSTGTVTLSGPAPDGGAVVSLSSGNSFVATVPGSVTIPAGSTSASFSVSTVPVSSTTAVTISAGYGGVGKSAILTITVDLTPILSSISVSPSSFSVAANGTQPFTATAKDQFGNDLVPQPVFTWTVSGGGTINGIGLFTAGSTAGGPYTVTATSGGVNGTASVTVTNTSTLTIGETSILGNNDSGNGNLLVAQQVSLGQTATILSMSFYVTTASGNLRLGIYDATGPGGGPGQLKAQTASFTPISGWNTQNVITPVSLPAGTYWLAYLPSSSTLGFRLAFTGSARWYNYPYGALPTTFSPSPKSGAYHWSFYATFGVGSVLNVTVVGSGSVTKSPDQSSYEAGEVVTLTAVPASGWAFAGWSGALSGTANPVQLTMNGPASVTATFTAVPGGGDPLGIVSDDFSGSTLDTGLWTFENPLGDGSVAMTGTQAAISVPAGTDHDVWRKGNLAPRLMQVAVDADFEVEAKFDSLPTQKYQMQGILVEQDAQNFLRFDFYSDGKGLRIFAASFTGGSPSVKSNKAIGGGGPPLYLRIKRVGDQWTQLYSYDGVTWLTNVTFPHALTVTAVGPFASNAQGSGPAPAYTGLVDYFFNTASPIVPEDG